MLHLFTCQGAYNAPLGRALVVNIDGHVDRWEGIFFLILYKNDHSALHPPT